MVLTQRSQPWRRFWFSLSLVFAAFYGFLAVQQAFSSPYFIQDDARQHIFWMQRYLDPGLFPDDLIADYFQAVAPVGYAAFYKGLALLGIEPTLVSKVLPPLLGLVAASYGYWLCLELFPSPLASFLASVMLSQSLWCSDELVSATPRAFLYPLLLAFLYYLVRQNHGLCLVAIALQAGFYPQIALISLGLVAIRLIHWTQGGLSLSKNKQDYWLLTLGCCLILGLILYMQGSADFGPVVTRWEALNMPEFQVKGRNDFFRPGLDYWMGGRSGIFHRRTFIPVTVAAGFTLPIVLKLPWNRRIQQQLTPHINMLLQLLVVSFGLYALAQLVLFRLHLPNRYTAHTIRLVLIVTSGITWAILLDNLVSLGHTLHQSESRLTRAIGLNLPVNLGLTMMTTLAVGVFSAISFYYPLFIDTLPKASYAVIGEAQPIYQFFAAQSPDSLIASLSRETSNLPAFSGRSVLVSNEHGLAYHSGYYAEFRQRSEDLITAHYADNPSVVSEFVRTYGVDFWLLDKQAFQPPFISENRWIKQFQPMAGEAIVTLQQGGRPILQQSIAHCTLLDVERWQVLDAKCTATFADTLN